MDFVDKRMLEHNNQRLLDEIVTPFDKTIGGGVRYSHREEAVMEKNMAK